MVKKQNSNINLHNLLMVVVAVAAIYLAWKLASIIILLITAAILAATLSPLVKWLEKRIGKKLSAALVTIALVIPLILVLISIIPAVIRQFDEMVASITNVIHSVPLLTEIFQRIDVSQYAKNAGNYLWTSTKAVSNFFTQLIILVFMVYYLLVDYKAIYKLILYFVPAKSKPRVDKAAKALAKISGQYVRGNLLISMICMLIIFSGLLVLRVPGAIALAVFAGIMDLLPLIGATIGAVPAVILAVTVSPLTGLLTVLLYWVYQEFENNVLIPRIYSQALNIIPLLSFLAVIVGTMLFGIIGAFLALPIAASIPTVMHYFQKSKHA